MTQETGNPTCLADYEDLAVAAVPAPSWAYVNGGAADQRTLRRNREAFDDISLLPRHLLSMRGGSTTIELFGTRFDYPILIAPVAYHTLVHPTGEEATAIAASAMRAGMVASTLSSVSLEDISRMASAPLWFQLYLQHHRPDSLALIRRAEAAGYRAIVVTIDAPINGVRNAEQRAGFQLPDDVIAVNLQDFQQSFQPIAVSAGESLFQSPCVDRFHAWSDIEWVVRQTRLPVLVKGVMSPHDAREAAQAGVSGLIVSNHGGRVLDTVPATIEVLPSVVEAADNLPVLLDGGIRRGTDVLKALALGASAVLVGRPILHGLAVGGPSGVAHVLHILRTEFEMAMMLCGCREVSEVDRRVIWAR